MGDDTSTAKLAAAVAIGNTISAVAIGAAGVYLARTKGKAAIQSVVSEAASKATKDMNPLALLSGGLSSGAGMDMGETGDIGTMDTERHEGPNIDLDDLLSDDEDEE